MRIWSHHGWLNSVERNLTFDDSISRSMITWRLQAARCRILQQYISKNMLLTEQSSCVLCTSATAKHSVQINMLQAAELIENKLVRAVFGSDFLESPEAFGELLCMKIQRLAPWFVSFEHQGVNKNCNNDPDTVSYFIWYRTLLFQCSVVNSFNCITF